MDQPTVLRTAKFGGFVKEDVLAYVDALNAKIYSLEEEVAELKQQLKACKNESSDKK